MDMKSMLRYQQFLLLPMWQWGIAFPCYIGFCKPNKHLPYIHCILYRSWGRNLLSMCLDTTTCVLACTQEFALSLQPILPVHSPGCEADGCCKHSFLLTWSQGWTCRSNCFLTAESTYPKCNYGWLGFYIEYHHLLYPHHLLFGTPPPSTGCPVP